MAVFNLSSAGSGVVSGIVACTKPGAPCANNPVKAPRPFINVLPPYKSVWSVSAPVPVITSGIPVGPVGISSRCSPGCKGPCAILGSVGGGCVPTVPSGEIIPSN